jgi:hypothetical protein
VINFSGKGGIEKHLVEDLTAKQVQAVRKGHGEKTSAILFAAASNANMLKGAPLKSNRFSSLPHVA